MEKYRKINTIIEYIIAIISFVSGILLIYFSTYFIYAYNFTSMLWLIMESMVILVSKLIIGILLVISTILIRKRKGPLLYRLSGMLITLYPININLPDLWDRNNLFDILIISPIGLLLYLFFNQKRYKQHNKLRNKSLLSISLLIYLIVDIIFYHWNY